MDAEMSAELKRTAQPGFDAILRWLRASQTNTAKISPAASKSPLRVASKTRIGTQPERRAAAS
jgi:hypothetical protein